MQLFKNIGVQSILTNRSFRSKVTIMLKYQIEMNDKIWVYTVEKLGPTKSWLVIAEMNGALRRCILKVLIKLEYSEKMFYLMSVFNELRTCLCTIESLLLEFMKPSLCLLDLKIVVIKP